MKRIAGTVFAVAIICAFSAGSMAGEKTTNRSSYSRPISNATNLSQFHTFKQGFDLTIWLSNSGTMGRAVWLGVPPDNFGMEYPRGSGIEHLYGAGPWIGAIVDTSRTGTPKLIRAVSTGYEGWSGPLQEMFGNPDGRDSFYITSIDSGNVEPNRRGFDDDGDGRIDEDELDGTDNDGDWNPATDDLGTDGLPDTLETGCDGGWSIGNPDPAHDNWDSTAVDSCTQGNPIQSNRFVRTQGNGFPNHDEPNVDEDYAAVSEQDVYVSYSDVYGNPSPVLGHVPLGIKVWQRSYAWQDRVTAAIIPIELSVVNIGRYTLDSVYVGFFADYDVGPINVTNYFGHNSAGYMADLRLAYVQNVVDRPSNAAGLVALGAGDGPLDSLRFSFKWYPPYQSPTPDRNRYEIMSSGTIQPDEYPASSDTRVLLSFGPIRRGGGTRISPGDTIRFTVALLAGNLIQAAQLARTLFLNNFVTGVEVDPSGSPENYRLHQNYPNPFNPATVIRYSLTVSGYVRLRIYDVLGREVAVLVDGVESMGVKSVGWNASGVASGIYFYRLEATSVANPTETLTQTRKMLIVR